MTEDETATLTTYITDMHALISHGLQAIDRQVETLRGTAHTDALAAAIEFQRTLRAHLTMLDARARAFDGKVTRPLKDAVSTITGFFAGLINTVRPEKAAKALRDDYTFLSHVAVGYLMLATTARGLGDGETAAVAELGYRDAARLIILIDRTMPALVLAELREDGLTVADVSEQLRELIRHAWRREAEELGFGASANL